MADFYFSVNLDSDRKLCLAPLTDRRLAMAGIKVADTSGYFLFEQRGGSELGVVEIIAQVFSDDAAFKLRDMLKMA